MEKKKYLTPEIEIEKFSILTNVATATSGWGWEEEDDPAEL